MVTAKYPTLHVPRCVFVGYDCPRIAVFEGGINDAYKQSTMQVNNTCMGTTTLEIFV
jgi:hypothetical protein